MDDIDAVWVMVVVIDTLVGAIIGNWRGRLVAGTLWGLVIGPIGWLLVALGPNKNVPASAPCPYCLQSIPLRQSTCAHCKNRVIWVRERAMRSSGPGVDISR